MWQESGFLKEDADVKTAMQRLSYYIESLPARFRAFSPEELLNYPAPGKWSRQQILGHLIDSGINNLKRFTDIQVLPQPYIVQSYRQEELVQLNHYQHLPLEHLLRLWQSINRQIVYLVLEIPADRLDYPVDPQYDNHEMRSLGWIISDYVAHMEHHFRQIEAS
jgi:DinB superfamily